MFKKSFLPPFFIFCLFSLLSFGSLSAVHAADARGTAAENNAVKPVLPADQAKDLLAVLNDPAQRQKLVDTLQSLQKVQASNTHKEPHSVVESGLIVAKDVMAKAEDGFYIFLATIANFKGIWPWFLQVLNDPALQQEIVRISVRLALVGLGGWGLSFVFSYLFRGIRGRIKEKAKTISLRSAEIQANLALAKQESDQELEEAERLEEIAKQKRREAENAAQEEAARKAMLAQQGEVDHQETLAQAENLAAKQALEEVENQHAAAQAMAVADSGAVPLETFSKEVDAAEHSHETASEPSGAKPAASSAEPQAQAKLSQSQQRALEAAERIKKLDIAAQEAEALAAQAESSAQEVNERYIEIRNASHRENIANHWRRISYATASFMLDLVGIAMFPFLALLIQIFDPAPDARTMAAVWSVTWFANVVQTLWVAVLRILFNPGEAWLRMTSVSDQAAKFLFTWLRRISGFVAWSLTIIIIFQACTLPGSVSAAIGKLVSLFANLMLARMILGARPYVRRACIMVANRTPRLATVAHLIGQLWWVAALFFDFALWWVWAVNMRDGYRFIFWTFLKTCLALAAARILWFIVKYFLEKGEGWLRTGEVLDEEMQERFLSYYPALQKTLGIVVFMVTLLFLAVAWGVPANRIFASNSFGGHLLSSGGTILFSLILGVFVWEGVNIFFDRQSKKLEEADYGQKQRAARIRTLQPLFKILLLSVLVGTIGMTALSQLGVNIAPLLASASIFGVAIGFGSQKLVHDFISGVFLLLENALGVGDAVTLNSTYGRVEKLSLRTVHVRTANGALHIFPFSALNEITNHNRGFCRVVAEANVAYGTDVNEVKKIFLEIAQSLNNDPNYADYIIDELDFWGLDHFNDSSLCIKATLPVTPAGRWPVTYEFNRRMSELFKERNIDIPFPMRTLNVPSFESFLKKQEEEGHGAASANKA